MQECGIRACVNPCGVQYNPVSIARLIEESFSGVCSQDTLFEYDGRWRSWLLPTKHATLTKEEMAQAQQDACYELYTSLKRSRLLIVTFGTSWIYEHIPSATSPYAGIVGNCHKVPAKEFERYRLPAEEIEDLWIPLLQKLMKMDVRVIFTVSPIRHFKDGAHENTLSKATLHLAIDRLVEEFPNMCAYFPAYELLMDDLRDYRFYASDMLHPSPTAVEYIWQRFMQTYYDEAGADELRRRERELRRSRHRTIVD